MKRLILNSAKAQIAVASTVIGTALCDLHGADMRFQVVATQTNSNGNVTCTAFDPGTYSSGYGGGMGSGYGSYSPTTVTMSGANASATAVSSDGNATDLSSLASAIISNAALTIGDLYVPQCTAGTGIIGGGGSSLDGFANGFGGGGDLASITVTTLDPGYVTALVIKTGGTGIGVTAFGTATANGQGYFMGFDPGGAMTVNFGWQPAGFQVILNCNVGVFGGFGASGGTMSSFGGSVSTSASVSGVVDPNPPPPPPPPMPPGGPMPPPPGP